MGGRRPGVGPGFVPLLGTHTRVRIITRHPTYHHHKSTGCSSSPSRRCVPRRCSLGRASRTIQCLRRWGFRSYRSSIDCKLQLRSPPTKTRLYFETHGTRPSLLPPHTVPARGSSTISAHDLSRRFLHMVTAHGPGPLLPHTVPVRGYSTVSARDICTWCQHTVLAHSLRTRSQHAVSALSVFFCRGLIPPNRTSSI